MFKRLDLIVLAVVVIAFIYIRGPQEREAQPLPPVQIPAGSFMMGSPSSEPNRDSDEGPQHEVTFSDPFEMSVHEVTVAQYRRFFQATNHREPTYWSLQRRHPNRPVVYVSWDDAVAYCQWLSDQESGTYRLPTEAEWEYACRAGTTTAYHTGISLSSDDANFRGGHDGTSDVGSYAPNAWGLCDMHGNVWEWCQDVYACDFCGSDRATEPNPINDGPSRAIRVLRGGSWDAEGRHCRSAYRISSRQDSTNGMYGFRVVRTP